MAPLPAGAKRNPPNAAAGKKQRLNSQPKRRVGKNDEESIIDGGGASATEEGYGQVRNRRPSRRACANTRRAKGAHSSLRRNGNRPARRWHARDVYCTADRAR